jgi:TonB family protein
MNTATKRKIRVRCDGGEPLLLAPGSELGAGGQATVYPVPGRPDRVAKIYRDPAPEQELKLRRMLARRPAGASPMGSAAGIFAWPLELLRDEDDRLAGLLLPRVDGRLRVFELYNPATRRERAPLFHHGLLHRAARNLAAAFDKLHEAGYVVGDVNESNILVGEDGRVVLIDTDSFQVPDPSSGTVYRCPVGRPEFTPPELRERSFADVDRAPEHDRFGLGVLVFQMLMEGTHPFAGRFRGAGEPPSIQERIAAGHFPYGLRAGGVLEPPRTAPPLQLLAPGVRDLVRRCFEDGHHDPAARPSAAEWRDALAAAEESLATCGRNGQHRYGAHLGACPWCERARQLEGRDPFPSAAAVRRGEHRHRPMPVLAARHRRSPAAPRPLSRPAVNRTGVSRGTWSLPAPALDALLGTALVLAPFAAIIMGVSPPLVVLVCGGLLVAARRLVLPGTRAQWTAAVAVLVLLVLARGFHVGSADPGDPATPWPTTPGFADPRFPPRDLRAVAVGYAPEALDRAPVLQDTAALLAAVASLPLPDAAGENEPEYVLRFILDRWGEVDTESVQLFPDPGTYALGVFRGRLGPVEFSPGELGGQFVPTEMRVTLRGVDGTTTPDLASASWNRGTDDDSPPTGVTPVLQDTAALLAAVASLPVPDAAGKNGPEYVLRFVLNTSGEVDTETVQLTPDPGTYALGVFRGRLKPVRFRPGQLGGHFVSTEMQVTLRGVDGTTTPDLASTSWSRVTDDAPQTLDVADAEVKPQLLNGSEVQALLAEMYPPLLRDAGVTGQAVMKFVVDAEGAVVPGSIVVVSSTHTGFAEASAAVVAAMRFSPAGVRGRAVPVLVNIPISWTLERS